MAHLDPFGMGRSTPDPGPSDPDRPIETPEHEEEIELAKRSPSVETEAPSPDADSSDLDPALRLQDSPATWLHGDDADLAGEAQATPDGDAAEPAAEPYAPLYESDDQGV